MNYLVVMSARGNPDFRQADGPLPGVPRCVLLVASLKVASKACLDYIEEWDLGSGNWSGRPGLLQRQGLGAWAVAPEGDQHRMTTCLVPRTIAASVGESSPRSGMAGTHRAWPGGEPDETR